MLPYYYEPHDRIVRLMQESDVELSYSELLLLLLLPLPPPPPPLLRAAATTVRTWGASPASHH